MIQIWHLWIISAFILFIAEIFTPGFLVACFGISCLVTSIVAYLGMGVKIQVLTFSVSTLVVFFGIRPFVLKYFYSKESKIKTNVDALIGKKGRVTERIDSNAVKGRVIIGGEDWRAVSVDEKAIEKDVKIEVNKVEGTKLFVKPAAE